MTLLLALHSAAVSVKPEHVSPDGRWFLLQGEWVPRPTEATRAVATAAPTKPFAKKRAANDLASLAVAVFHDCARQEGLAALRATVAQQHSALSQKRFDAARRHALRSLADAATVDGLLPVLREQVVATIVGAIVNGDFDHDLETQAIYALAQINSGRLPDRRVSMNLAPGEVGHHEFPAFTTRQTAVRRSGSTYVGTSIPLGFGLRSSVGGSFGGSRTAGFESVPDDSGLLIVTSRRVVFMGQRTTIEVPYERLLRLTMFFDGLALSVSGRQKSAAISIPHPARVRVAAAAISVAYGAAVRES